MFKGIEHVPYPARAAAIVREATAELTQKFGCPVSIELDTDIVVGDTVIATAKWVSSDFSFTVTRTMLVEQLDIGPSQFAQLIAVLTLACEAYVKPESRHAH